LGNFLRVIQSCRQENVPIILTQHGHMKQTSEGEILRQWWGELIVHGTEEWEFILEIKTEPEDMVLSKKRYSAFFETDLDTILRSKGIKT